MLLHEVGEALLLVEQEELTGRPDLDGLLAGVGGFLQRGTHEPPHTSLGGHAVLPVVALRQGFPMALLLVPAGGRHNDGQRHRPQEPHTARLLPVVVAVGGRQHHLALREVLEPEPPHQPGTVEQGAQHNSESTELKLNKIHIAQGILGQLRPGIVFAPKLRRSASGL